MPTMYTLLKFLHIAAAIVWIGGVVALTVLNARIARTGDRSLVAAMARESAFYGGAIIGSAAGVVLVAGVAMVAIAHLRVATLWIAWGLGGMLAFVVIGAILTRRTAAELGALAATASPDETRVQALQRRPRLLTAVSLVLLFSVVWAMVFKPIL